MIYPLPTRAILVCISSRFKAVGTSLIAGTRAWLSWSCTTRCAIHWSFALLKAMRTVLVTRAVRNRTWDCTARRTVNDGLSRDVAFQLLDYGDSHSRYWNHTLRDAQGWDLLSLGDNRCTAAMRTLRFSSYFARCSSSERLLLMLNLSILDAMVRQWRWVTKRSRPAYQAFLRKVGCRGANSQGKEGPPRVETESDEELLYCFALELTCCFLLS